MFRTPIAADRPIRRRVTAHGFHTDARTEYFPLAAWLVGGHVDGVILGGQVDLGAVVRPRAELHRAALVVERKPLDVDGARRDEESEWNPRDCAGRVDDRVGRKLAVDVLVRAARHTHDAKSSIYRLNEHRPR